MYRIFVIFSVVVYISTACNAAGQNRPDHDLMDPEEEREFMSQLREEVPDSLALAALGSEQQFRLLDRASYSYTLQGVRYLLDLGIDVNLKESSGRNALHYPAWNGVLPIVKLLVEHGIDVNSEYKANGGLTPLNCAAERGDMEIVKYLIEHGADVHYSNSETGSSPLRSAAYGGNYDVFVLLAGMMPRDYEWQQALVWAIIGGDMDILKYVVEEKKADVNKEAQYWGYPIHQAAAQRFCRTNIEMIEYLLSQGADFKQVNGGRVFPWALENCNETVIIYLIEKGFDPRIEKSGGGHSWTGLAKALDDERFDLAKVLLKQENDFTFRDMPLVVYFADGMYNSPQIISFLIDNGINKEHYNEALLCSAAAGDAKSVALLIEAGADAAYTGDGRNGLAVTDDLDVAQLLIEHGCDTRNPYALAKLSDSFGLLRAYSEMDVDVPLSHEELDKGLHRAAYRGDEWAVEYFLYRKADPNVMLPLDGTGTLFTSLMANAIQGYTQCRYNDDPVVSGEIMRRLIEEGGDVTAVDENGLTPLHHAAASYHCRIGLGPIPMGNRRDREQGMHGDPAWPPGQSKEEVIGHLLDAGANVNARDKAGDTPLHLAVRAGNLPAVRILLTSKADTRIKGRDGLKALEQLTDPHIMNYILESGPPDLVSQKSMNESFEQVIRQGSSRDKYARLSTLLDNGAQVDHKLYGGEYNSLLYLIKNAYPNWFSYEENRKLVELLVDKGIDRDGRNRDGQTALHLAASKKDNHDLIKYLIDNGFDVNASDKKGNTPLIYAVTEDDNRVAGLLVDRGAEINTRNNDMSSALTIAWVRGNSDIRMLLEAAGATQDTTAEWWYAVANSYAPGSLDHLRRLARDGFDIEARSSYLLNHRSTHEVKIGMTALLYFAHIGNEECLRAMVELGGDLNARNADGRTAMGILKLKSWSNATALYDLLKKNGGTE